ncbi:MAG: hypothetical protein LBJ96_01875 [Holosporaceae bacterium]|jgi:hypothetical protein|nr:hypothetical protein [Holosporaceae bacterium]
MEFAFAIPVMIAVIYYLHDVPKLKRTQNSMKFCAHCAVNMFQNISLGRPNKRITLQDYKYISCSAFLPYYGGGTQQYGGLKLESYAISTPQMSLCYLKGTGINKVKMIWAVVSNWGQPPPSRQIGTMRAGASIHDHIMLPRVYTDTEYDASYICEDLKINAGEVKMMVDVYLNASWCPGGMFGKRRVSPGLWGLLVCSPEAESWGSNMGGWFHYKIIFTPKLGLFDEDLPG